MIRVTYKKPLMNIFTVILLAITMIVVSTGAAFAQRVYHHPHGPHESYTPTLLPRAPYLPQSPGLDSVIRYDFTITLRDSVIIDCLKYIPFGLTPPTGGWPTVIMCHGYGDNKETLAKFCHDQATYGYYTATYSMRGQGNSGGLSNLISNVEMQDLLEFITYVKNDSLNGSNPGNILIMGGSQGGLIPYMAACNGAPVKTIISALAPPNFASSWIENGCIKMTLLWTVTYTPDTARYDALVSQFPVWIYANNKEKWDSLAYWLPIGRDFMNQVPNNHVPMIIEGSWQDKFFNADGLMQGASLMQAPFRQYIGAVIGHGGDQSTTENDWHMQFFNDWFFYWLFGVQNGTMDAPTYEYASTEYPRQNDMWSFAHDSSRIALPQISTNMRLYFNTNSRLTTSAATGSNTVSFANHVSGGLTMQQAVDDEFKGTDFTSRFQKATRVFTSSPLTTSLTWVGTPHVNLNYSSNANTFCQYNFQIYEVTPGGQADFITRINFTDRNYVKNNKRTINIKGQSHSHIFQAGDRIRVIVTNLDTAPPDSTFLATNPFVLPVLINSTNTMYLNNSMYLDLPVKTTAGNQVLALKDEEATQPYAFSLRQNYPNPFNPVTTIEFSIPNSAKVELKVYDLLGREVATLVNEYKQAGNYNIQFNALSLASGVYFYKITAGSFQDVKKMILIK